MGDQRRSAIVGTGEITETGRGRVLRTAVVDARVLSVEYEDPVWCGTPAEPQARLEIAHRTLRPLVIR